MNVMSRLRRVQDLRPGSHNGAASRSAAPAGVSVPPLDLKGVVMLTIPLLVAAVGIMQRRRSSPSDARTAAEGRTGRTRHRPRSFVRYYGLGLLINALERDATRKAVIAVLKLMQKRA